MITTTGILPRIRRYGGLWLCVGQRTHATGITCAQAYEAWRQNAQWAAHKRLAKQPRTLEIKNLTITGNN